MILGKSNTPDVFKHWARTIMYDKCIAMLEELNPNTLDVLEISSSHVWKQLGFKSYTETKYPEFDICKDKLERQFDLIIADQVFEHLLWPYQAAKNIHLMLKPGGYLFITTPFLIKIHDAPYDCTRWTETGMRYFLNECGFHLSSIRTSSWGNRACIKANLNRWVNRSRFRSLKNEPNFPVVVWTFARKEFS
jgi:SAM-dependent methyltransferase